MTDLVEFIERAYDVESGTEAWLRGLGHGLRSLFGGGLGVVGFLFDASDASSVKLSGTTTLEKNEKVVLALKAATAMAPAWFVRKVYWGGVRCATMEQALGDDTWNDSLVYKAFVSPFGVKDFFSLRCSGPDHRGVLLSTALRARHDVSRRQREIWEQLGAHVASAARLRASFGVDANAYAPSDLGSSSAAVLSSDGRVEHATGDATSAEARERLTEAGRRMDRARGRLRRADAEEAVALWTALVDGRWSLLDWIDHDGRRYVLARENPSPGPAAATLTPRERQVMALVSQGDANKLVAYELGISEEAVAVHVHHAARKLGARSRVDLVRAYRNLVAREGVS